jgi:GntR family transcriptional repressor for pyruvate dehydrogenase complex
MLAWNRWFRPKCPAAGGLVTTLQMQPVGKRRLSTQVAERLRDYIVERRLQAGDRLPSERDLAAALAVSRHVVREAIRMLEEQGLVAVGQGKDTVVRHPPPPLEFPESLPRGAASLEIAMDARSVFEAGLADCLVERATEADIDRLDAIVAEMRRRVQLGHPGSEDDLAFHAQLHRCTYNPDLIQIGRLLVIADIRARLMRMSVTSLLGAPEEIYPEHHAAIVTLLRARDADGLRRLLRGHAYYPQDAPTGRPADASDA